MIRDKVCVGARFQVADAGGRRYTVTPYHWMAEDAGGWRECWRVLMTEFGGVLEEAGLGAFVIEGTGTRVTRCPPPA